MSSGACEDCVEVKKLHFQVEGLNLVVQRHKVELDGVQQDMVHRDIEHDTIIQGVANRMDTMEQRFDRLEKSVTKDISDMRDEIPQLFLHATNALLARIAKWLISGIVVIVLVIIIAVGRPAILSGIQGLYQWVQQVEVPQYEP
jgi:hypothetical protein